MAHPDVLIAALGREKSSETIKPYTESHLDMRADHKGNSKSPADVTAFRRQWFICSLLPIKPEFSGNSQ